MVGRSLALRALMAMGGSGTQAPDSMEVARNWVRFATRENGIWRKILGRTGGRDRVIAVALVRIPLEVLVGALAARGLLVPVAGLKPGFMEAGWKPAGGEF